jgi:hypothetical protein
MIVNQSHEKQKGKYFIRVLLCSGTRFNPMGNEEVAVFCQCAGEEPSAVDVDREGLLRWVNSNPACRRNQSNERYRISKDTDAMSVIFLTDREIQACQSANRIYQC